MQLRLNKIEVINFKRVKHFELDLNGKDALIVGKNGVGKTTLIDAWAWILTDSNSEQQNKFNILELDKKSEQINNQDAIVRVELKSDEKTIKLEKAHRQVWSKKRGQAQSELAKHTTDYFWDEVKISKTEFTKRLETLAPIKILRTLTDVYHFCDRLKADDRRQILVDLIGNIKMKKICDEFDELKELPALIENKSLDDFKTIQRQRKKEADEQLKIIPARIDELRKMIPNIDKLDEIKLRERQTRLDEEINLKKNELVSISSNETISKLRADKARLETMLSEIESQVKREMMDKTNHLYKDQRELRYKHEIISKDLRELNVEKDHLDEQIYKNDQERDRLYKEYVETSENVTDTCKTCGQSLPNDIAEQIEDHRKSKLQAIENMGMTLKQAKIDIELKRQNTFSKIDKLMHDESNLVEKIEALSAEIKAIDEATMHKIEERQNSTKEKIIEIVKQIETPNNQIQAAKDKIQATIGELTSEYEKARHDISLIVQSESAKRRIKEREKDLKKFAQQYEDAEKGLYLIELYSHKRAEYLEASVNNYFEITQWKLFEKQNNGGVREICEPMFEGVPYATDLNTGAKINVGLDCIKTLSKHYKIKMPIFVDNAESISSWEIDLDQQMIKLAVAANIDELQVINE